MEEPGGAERRCPNCGAVALSDAQWCWRCYQPLPTPEPEPEPEPASEAAPQVPARPDEGQGSNDASTRSPGEPPAPPAKSLSWPCAACGHENGIELEVCERCGTSFAALMRTDDKLPDVPPPRAFRRSLIYPGLGHAMVGRSLDGIARGALFAMLLMMTVIVLLSGSSSGLDYAVLGLFIVMCLLVYLETAWEAYRLASGDAPLISSRMLLWIATGVILGSSAILAYTLAIVARR
jgi:hypothetical protein